MKTTKRIASVGTVMIVLLLVAGFTCNQAKSAATAVNRYAESLSHFQDAAKIEHDNARIDDGTYRNILNAEKVASTAGHHLDTAIGIANQGGNFNSYIDEANKSFEDLLTLVKGTNNQNLLVAVNTASALLKNAITMIQQIKAQTKASAPVLPGNLAFWLSFGVLGLAFDVKAFTALLNEIAELEPVAFDLVAKLVGSLSGKSTEEVLAMNEAIFAKVDAEVDSEIAALDAKANPPKP